MARSIYDPIVGNVSEERRRQAQEEFGRHLIEQRDRMAVLVRKWIETDSKFPVPIHDRLLDRIRRLPSSTRADIASISLLMSDQVVSAMLAVFARGDETRINDRVVNYAIVAQVRERGSEALIDEVDINRGQPVIALWDDYKRWLSRFGKTSYLRMK